MSVTFIALGALILLGGYVALVFLVNLSWRARAQALRFHKGTAATSAGTQLSLCTWNLGYAGLGEESDFIVDGGTHLLPPSRRIVRKNIDGILTALKAIHADVYLFQEVAKSGLLTRWTNLKLPLERSFADCAHSFHADTLTRLVPPPLRLVHGAEIVSRYVISAVETLPLPGEGGAFFGVVRKSYNVHLARLTNSSSAGWTIMNIHLAAFDEGANARKQQLAQLLTYAQREFESGRHVVIGGDWNLMLVPTSFPATADPKHRFWLHDMPQDAIPMGWQLAFDPATPSVRTDEQAYVKGVNATAIIDGFLVSPNVDVKSVHTVDLDFKFSDHQPVQITVAMKPSPV